MREKLFFGFFVATSIALLGGSAFADVAGRTDNNTSIDIPDASLNGVPNSTNTITITENEIIEEATFSIEGLSHRWAGDLVAIVSHVESGRSVTLFSRIGRDNPNLGVGSNVNFQGDYVFEDATNNRLWDELGNGGTDFVLPTTQGSYRAAAGLTGANIVIDDPVTGFGGLTTEGTWRLELTDRNATVEGSFREFTVDFQTVAAVPEPSTLVLLMAAGMVGTGIRRRI